MDEYKLFDAEYRLLSIIWENEPVNSKIYDKICDFLNCEIEDIVKHIK